MGSIALAARVLIVDDNEDHAEMLSESLSMVGYMTSVAEDARKAVAIAARQVPHLALLDLGLPGVDGFELAAQLRGLPGLQALRLVAVTGYGTESVRRRSVAAGFHAHLIKPASFDLLLATMDRLIAQLV